MSLKSGRVGVNPACIDPVNGKIVNIPDDALNAYQKKQLSESLTIKGTVCTTVEAALAAITTVINALQ